MSNQCRCLLQIARAPLVKAVYHIRKRSPVIEQLKYEFECLEWVRKCEFTIMENLDLKSVSKWSTNRGWCTYPSAVVRRTLIHEIPLRFEIFIEVKADYDQIAISTPNVADSYVYRCLQNHATAIGLVTWRDGLIDDDWYVTRIQGEIALRTVRPWIAFIFHFSNNHRQI